MFNLKFKALFGRFNYDFNFNDDVTIITGPNGYGKSTILRTIDAISKGINGINYFVNLNFEKMQFSNLKTNEKITIKKTAEKLYINDCELDLDFFKNIMFYILQEERYYIRKVDDNKVYDRRKDQLYTIEEYILNNFSENEFNNRSDEFFLNINLRYNFSKKFKDKDINKNLKAVQEIKEKKEIVKNIYYIKEQRLIITDEKKKREDEDIEFIKQLPGKLKKIITEVSNNYSAISNKLDSSYPDRLFSTEVGITKEEYEKEMDKMKEKLEKIKKFDISDIQLSNNLGFKDEHSKALKIYFDDFQQKYKVYEQFIEQLELFTNIINSRLNFKKIKISRDNGIIVIDDNNTEIELRKLSSGEQQEIVLFYKLIFDVEENVLLLIDEPEISLHILWQKKFMDDLLSIINHKKISVIVATHSPQIISNHLDKQIDLGKLYSSEFDIR